MLVAVSHFFIRLLAALFCVLGLAMSAAWAQTTLVSQGLRHGDALPSVQITQLAVLPNVDEKWALADVMAGQAGAFVPQQDMMFGSKQWGSVVWARITLSATPASSNQLIAALTVLELPKNYLDHVRLYTLMPAPAGQLPTQWLLQEAGDTLAPDRWSVKGLFPRFILPSAEQIKASGNTQQVLYLQVIHNAPYAVPITVMSAAQAVLETQRRVLAMGLILGAILMTVVMVGSLAWLYRDAIYSWYCVYALFAGLTCASHAGFAHQIIWPVDGPLPGLAVLMLLLLTIATQVQFSLRAFIHEQSKPWLPWVAHAVTAAFVIGAVGFVLLPDQLLFMYTALLVLVAIAIVLVTGLVVSAAAHRSNLAKAWLLAYVPLVVIVVFGLMEGVGLTSGKEAFYQLPIYAAGIAIIFLGTALQWFARERHGEKERERALASTDPLTGFASANSFRQQLRNAWQSPPYPALDTAVVYIALRNEIQSAQRLEHLLRRSVRVLRSATNSQDVVARLDGHLLALLLPGAGMGEQLSQRLSRIIALGLMPDSSDTKGDLLQFRIAYTTRLHYRHDLAQLHQQLRELLEEKTRWGTKPIRVIDHRRSGKSMPREVIDSSGLEDKWNQALAAVNEQAAPQSQALTTDPSPR
jgi:two-component system, sensor histidine kinase LadS